MLGTRSRTDSTREQAHAGFLPQVQALRAVAVAAVVAFHLWPDVVPGGYVGVDVFFALSGYLITGQLTSALSGDAPRLSLRAFWSRRARRLLPLSLVVLLATLAATVLWAPVSVWRQYASEAGAAGGYFVNWHLAARATDYFGADELASPVQHYWSLSVEEQFYVLWPLLLVGLAWSARRVGRDVRATFVLGIASMGLLSLGYSVWQSAHDPAAAYFSTFTHAWEFAAGGLTCVLASGRAAATRTTHPSRALLSWCGIALVVGTSFWFDAATPFPSWWAGLPVGGALAVVLAGDVSGPLGTSAVFGRRPVQVLGEISYAVYLWHWPLIVLVPVARGSSLGAVDRLGVLAVTLGLAAASKVLVEDPARFGRTALRLGSGTTLAIAGAGTLLVVGAAAGVMLRADDALEDVEGTRAQLEDRVFDGDIACFGALAMDVRASCDEPFLLDPALELVATTWPKLGEAPTVEVAEGISAQRYGHIGSDRRILLVGDSHARMYLPVLEPVARRNGWELQLVWHGDCSPSAPTWESSLPGDQNPSSAQFRQAIAERLGDVPADLIITSSVAPRYANHETPEVQSSVADAFVDMWTRWTSAGRRVLVIAGVPGPGKGGSECFSQNRSANDPCTRPASEVLELDPMVVAAGRASQPTIRLLDLTDAYCTGDGVCHQVVGRVQVYLGGSHIGPAFALSLGPRIEEAIRSTMGPR